MGTNVVAIVGARLNSSRLPRKQLLDLAGKPLIGHVFERLSHVPSIDKAVLATTADNYNQDLCNWADDNNVVCYAHRGDVNDLMGRIDAVVNANNAHIVIYICGDSPLIEPSTIHTLVQKLIATPDADWARMKELPEGQSYIHEGFAVYRRSFWDQMVAASHKDFEKEHVGAVFHSLGKIKPSKTAYAEEDPIFYSVDHRISVDTPSDYEFMQQIYAAWYCEHENKGIVSLPWVIERLKSDKKLTLLNKHVKQREVAEVTQSVRILTQADAKVGLGHVRRMTVAAKQIQDYLSWPVTIDIVGDEQEFDWLQVFPHNWYGETEIHQILRSCSSSEIVLLDVQEISAETLSAVRSARHNGTRVVVIDKVFDEDLFDGYYIPSFYCEPELKKRYDEKIVFGWSSYLLPTVSETKKINPNAERLVVLTGGGDFYRLGEIWPHALNEALPADIKFTWVQGPYAERPRTEGPFRSGGFELLQSPSDLQVVIDQADVALAVYGVSFFECLRLGVPTIAYIPEGAISEEEVEALGREGVCLIARSTSEAAELAKRLLVEQKTRMRLVERMSEVWCDQKDKPPLVSYLGTLAKLDQ